MTPSRYDRRSQVSRRTADGRRARVGPHIGPLRLTPTRVLLTVALLGGTGFLVYAVVVRDQLQVPLMASGFAIVGLVFAAIAVVGAANIVRAGREGRDGSAFLNAVVGGVAGIIALLSLAAAVIMGLILNGNP